MLRNLKDLKPDTKKRQVWILLLAIGCVHFNVGADTFQRDPSQVLSKVRSNDEKTKGIAKEEFRQLVASKQILRASDNPNIASQLRDIAANEKDEDIKNMAIISLKGQRDAQTKKLLEQLAVHSESRHSRITALQALPMVSGPASIEVLKQVLKNDPVLSVKFKAAAELGKLGDESGFSLGMEKIKDRNKFNRAEAAVVLGKIGNVDAVPELERLKSSNDYASGSALIALNSIKLKQQDTSERKIEFLKNSINSKGPLCGWAASELAQIGSHDSVQALVNVARAKVVYDSVEYSGQQCALNVLENLYFDGTGNGTEKVNVMIKTGIVAELPPQ